MSEMLPIEISVQEVNEMLQRGDEFLLVDVRELPEYQTASIAGATLIPLNQLQSSLDQLEPFRDKRIVSIVIMAAAAFAPPWRCVV